MVVVREILRLWLAGHGYRSIARRALIDRKSARRYVQAAMAAGLDRERGEEQLTSSNVVMGSGCRMNPSGVLE